MELQARSSESQPSTSQERKQPVVCFRNAYKHYGSKRSPLVVLDGLNMSVPKGSIYGLLGASGCGKTTLLNCILGQTNLNSGKIWTLGGPPGSKSSGVPGPQIGYMPQETALYGDFTIRETFVYFGWIAGMNSKQIEERFKMIVKLFLLPETNRMVRSLSGGEQRRLSLASAIFYGPELLLLDEPTVGLDPLLREIIWGHLMYISREENTTIIITTHYIEEARQAHIVALMRGGKLLAEESPERLLSQYKSQTLEDVFLKLSASQSVINQQMMQNAAGPSGEETTTSSSITKFFETDVRKTCLVSPPDRESEISNFPAEEATTEDTKYLHLTRSHMKALIWKNVLWWMRNVLTLVFILGLSILLILLFCFCVGQEPRDLPVAVFNYETNNAIDCNGTLICNGTGLSCYYLEQLKTKSIILTYYNSEDDARESVLYGKTFASIVVRRNYSAALRARINDWFGSKRWNMEYSSIDILRDVSNKLVANYLKLHMYDTFQLFFQDYLSSCDMNPKSFDPPIKWEVPVYGVKYPNFRDFAIPGALLTMNFLLAILLTSGAMLIERNEASLERTFVLGITEIELITAHIICEFVIMVVQSLLALTTAFCVFDLTLNGSLTLVVVLTVLSGFCGMCYGMLISCICDSYFVVNTMAIGTFLPLILLSGIVWPIEAMHRFLQPITMVLPLTKATESMRSILQKDWNLSSEVVYMGFVSIGIWTIIFLAFSIIALKYKIRLNI